MGVAVRVAPAQPSQSLAQLVHVHAAVLVTIQLLEEATPALSPLRIARAPPHGARGGGEARQRRPQRGLRGSPSPPGPRRASSAATATAASALPAWLWHLQEPVTANRRRPRRNWRLLPRPAWGGGGRRRSCGCGAVCRGCSDIAQPRKHQGSFWGEGRERSMVSILLSEFCLACLSLPSAPRGEVERYQGFGFVIPFHLTSLPY